MPTESRETSQWSPLEKLLSETLREQRLKRRWTIFFRLLFPSIILLSILFPNAILFLTKLDKSTISKPHIALVDIQGPIYKEGPNRAQSVIKALKKALENQNTVGVIFRINSPGGSPVQADQIYKEIQHYRLEYPQKPII